MQFFQLNLRLGQTLWLCLLTFNLCMAHAYSAPLPQGGLKINFAPQAAQGISGFYKETGKPVTGNRFGVKQTLGWVERKSGKPADISQFTRDRSLSSAVDVLRETFVHMDHPAQNGNDLAFKIQLPNGQYRVLVQVGDVLPEGQVGVLHRINAEGVSIVSYAKPSGQFGVKTASQVISVADGELNIDQVGGNNTKLHLLIVQPLDQVNTPAVIDTTPLDGASNVSLNTTIAANFLHLPNQSANGSTSLNNKSLTTQSVQLFQYSNKQWQPVQGSVNGTGGGDAINFSPNSPLTANTRYRYAINGVKDLTGVNLLPFSMEFTTGDTAATNTQFSQVAFERVGPLVKGQQFSSLAMGPEQKLYGLSIEGDIYRWQVDNDGQLSQQAIISTLPQVFDGPRLAIGLAFAPESTAKNLVAYVSHASFGFDQAPEFDGNISRLSGAKLENHEHILTGLPRSIRDHLTNSIAFRPNEPNVLYFLQGSNSAAGRADPAWGNRPERLLTAALLRLDLNRLPQDLPLNVQTSGNQAVINQMSKSAARTADGLYNPYYTNAPLTIYATGIRNAYDLVWHSNGQVYIPTNGTGGGSLTPASVAGTRRADGSQHTGQAVPAIGPNEVQRDFLFRINPQDPGLSYFGHPNPLRGEYVLNRGPIDAKAYPPTIRPDANYQGFAFDFGLNKSPNGVIEYKSNAHNGALEGALLVTRYSGGSDIIALDPKGPKGDISNSAVGITGLSGFIDPLDITEDTRNGNLYVSDYGDQGLYLLKPRIAGVPNKSAAVLSAEGITLEAEQAQLSGAQVKSGQANAQKNSFVDVINSKNDAIEWSVNIQSAGQDNLFIRYALGVPGNRAMQLSLDGVKLARLDFASTGQWDQWGYASAVAQLSKGAHKIRLTAIGDSGPNIDNLTLVSVDEPPLSGIVPGGQIFEAENANLLGAKARKISLGASGSFVDFIAANDESITWQVDSDSDQQQNLFIRYALASGPNRPMALVINGNTIAQLDFTPTGLWSQWGLLGASALLQKGANTIELRATGSSGPNVDQLIIKSLN